MKFAIDGIETGRPRWPPLMAPSAISVRRFEDDEAKLKAAKVVLDPQARKDIIVADARQLAFAQGFELVEDQVLARRGRRPRRVAGRADGIVRPGVLTIPDEVIRATVRNNQKCFVVSDPKTGN